MEKYLENPIHTHFLKEAVAKRELRKDIIVRDFLFHEASKLLSDAVTESDKPQKQAEIIGEPVPVIETTSAVPEISNSEENTKPMAEVAEVDFVPKRKNNKRRLLRSPPIPNLASVEKRLQKAADVLDKAGEVEVASKIDRLLKEIHKC